MATKKEPSSAVCPSHSKQADSSLLVNRLNTADTLLRAAVPHSNYRVAEVGQEHLSKKINKKQPAERKTLCGRFCCCYCSSKTQQLESQSLLLLLRNTSGQVKKELIEVKSVDEFGLYRTEWPASRKMPAPHGSRTGERLSLLVVLGRKIK